MTTAPDKTSGKGMGLTPGIRRPVLLLALTATLASAGWIRLHEPDAAPASDLAEAVIRVPAGTTAAANLQPAMPWEAALPADALKLTPRQDWASGDDLFAPLAVVAPVVAAPPPPVVQAVSAPEAPPLPFQYMGRMLERTPKGSVPGSAPRIVLVYLSRGDEAFAVKPGEQIDPSYRLVAIDGDSLVFEYLPLTKRQILSMESPN